MSRTPAILFACLASTVWAQDLPDGAGKETTERVCTFCHSSEMFAGSHRSPDDWDRTITSMTTDKNLAIADSDYAAVLDYLSTCLGSASVTININKAQACQLVTVLSITPKQAGAIVAYRKKNGDFKDLDGLKKVDGLDAAALDAKKASVTF